MLRVLVNLGTPQVWEFQLNPGLNSIGRGIGNDFTIEHPSISTAHCQILVAADSIQIQDLGSTNGTFVNDSRIEQASLRSGQNFRLGSVELRLERPQTLPVTNQDTEQGQAQC